MLDLTGMGGWLGGQGLGPHMQNALGHEWLWNGWQGNGGDLSGFLSQSSVPSVETVNQQAGLLRPPPAPATAPAAAPQGYAPAATSAMVQQLTGSPGTVYTGTPGWSSQLTGMPTDPNAHLFAQSDPYGNWVYYDAQGNYAGGGGYDNTP